MDENVHVAEDSPRPTVEETPCVDVRHLQRIGALAPGEMMPLDGALSGPLLYAGALSPYEIGVCTLGKSRKFDVIQRAQLKWTPCHFGGTRPWLRCPRCSERRRALYLLEGRLECRECLDLRYTSSQVRGDRWREACHRLKRTEMRMRKRGMVIGRCGRHDDRSPRRPKYMRHRVYEKLLAEWREAQMELVLAIIDMHQKG